MRKNDSVKNLMSEDIHSVQQGQAVSEAARILQDNGVHHVPVLDGKTLVGIVSSTDLMRLSMGIPDDDINQIWSYLDSQYQLIDVMTANPNSLNEGGTVRDAAESLASGMYHSLPVTDSDHQLVGMVTSTDLIRYLIDQY